MQKRKHENIDSFYDPSDLQSLCVSTSVESLKYYFSPEETLAMKELYFDLSSTLAKRISVLEKIKNLLNEDFSLIEIDELDGDTPQTVPDAIRAVDLHDLGHVGMKTLKARLAELLQRINEGSEIRKDTLYAVNYNEYGLMAYYDSTGMFVYQRPCTAAEMQMDITTTIHKLKTS